MDPDASTPHATGLFRRDGQTFYAKVIEVAEAERLDAEAEGLEALRAAGAIRVPTTIERGDGDGRAWLVLEWLELGSLRGKSAARLGAELAALHRIPQERFGWARNNYIGGSIQVNGWSDDWLDFWRKCRLLPQLELAARNSLPSRMIDRGERLVADCEALFANHRPSKSLLHGDLWGGNASVIPDGTPVVFDPAVYVGDREADLAMTELLGGFPADFAAAYRATWPLADSYSVRRDFYNLYHLLNHANLFAGGYVSQAAQSIERLLAEVR